MSIKSKIQSLIAAANAKTEHSDTTLTDAVQTLCAGYGQGGGSGRDPLVSDAVPVCHVTCTLDSDFTESSSSMPLDDAQAQIVKNFVQNHLFGVIAPFVSIIKARDDVEKVTNRFSKSMRMHISNGNSASIGNNNLASSGVYCKFTSAGKLSSSNNMNASLFGFYINLSEEGDATLYLKCNATMSSIGAGTYDIWIIVFDDSGKFGPADGMTANPGLSAGDALNLLTGGEM